jgi:hypothetical protein
MTVALLIVVLIAGNGCALLLRAAPAAGRAGAAGALARGARGAPAVPRGSIGQATPPAPVGGLLFASSQQMAAGIGALALGRALPRGIARMYAPTGQSLGYVETRGATAHYYDNFGRLNVRSELVDTTMHFYDVADTISRSIGYSRPASGNQVNFYTPEGRLVGYQVLDGGRIVWHFEADGALIGYTILGEVDLAALGVASDAIGYHLAAPIAPLLLGGGTNKQDAKEPSIAQERSIKPLSTRVVGAADTLFNVGNRCRTEGHVDSCREVSLAYADLSEAIREEMVRLSRPQEKKEN